MGLVTLAYAGMPVTTFHFGPGALLKALVPRWISLTAFVISQVVVDLESGYHLLRHGLSTATSIPWFWRESPDCSVVR